MNELLSGYFGFNKQQRRGVFVLITLSFILLIVRLSLNQFISPEPLLIENLPLIKEAARTMEPTKADRHLNAERFIFDPNTATFIELSRLGIREKTCSTIVKMRKSGFVFRKPDDFKKVYGLGEHQFQGLSPFIRIASEGKVHSRNQQVFQTAEEKIELNTADSLSLVDLPMVGPAFARKIIRYRESLGGFVHTSQLMEVYGFTPEMYSSVKRRVTADSTLIKKLNINIAGFKEINRHPYISYELTKHIMNARRKANLTEATYRSIIPDTLQSRLRPYVALE